eukprot:scaffold29645_cov66-Attheya_sp.AAC.1
MPHEKLDQREREREDPRERSEIGTHTLTPDGTCRKERAQPTTSLKKLTDLDVRVDAVPALFGSHGHGVYREPNPTQLLPSPEMQHNQMNQLG